MSFVHPVPGAQSCSSPVLDRCCRNGGLLNKLWGTSIDSSEKIVLILFDYCAVFCDSVLL